MSFSWNAPRTWSEVAQSIERGISFRSRSLGIQGAVTTMAEVRSERPGDIVYVVFRDGETLASVTRDGQVLVNPHINEGLQRHRSALGRVLPALRQLAKR